MKPKLLKVPIGGTFSTDIRLVQRELRTIEDVWGDGRTVAIYPATRSDLRTGKVEYGYHVVEIIVD